MKSSRQAEHFGAKCTTEFLDRLPKCKDEYEACSVTHDFLVALCNQRGQKRRRAFCSGVTTVLVNVLHVGLETIKREARSNER